MTLEVEIFEVGPRDGLQNEQAMIATADKVALIHALIATGLPRVEVASFVSPKWVPQMGDGVDVVRQVDRQGSNLYALVPNQRGLETALTSGVQGYCLFIAASEGFSRANTNVSRDEGLARAIGLLDQIPSGIVKRGYISCVAECPYDGAVDPGVVAQLAKSLWRAGCDEISLGDTLGRATPNQIDQMLKAVCDVVPASILAGHYHDTNGGALENIDVSLDRGLRIFDASIAGLGGCPYAPGAKGNVATEQVFDHLVAKGYSIKGGVDRTGLTKAAKLAQNIVKGADHGV